MNEKKAKKIRKEHQENIGNSKAVSYESVYAMKVIDGERDESGRLPRKVTGNMIIADENRRTYQKAKGR